MTERDADERLRAAFQTDGDPGSGPVPDELQEQIWRAVSGDLDPEQRRALVERTAADPAAAEAWRVANALWQARHEGSATGESRPAPPISPFARVRPWTSPWLAAAAALVIVSTLVSVRYWRGGSGDEFRVVPETTVESVIPDDAALPRDDFRLRWTPGPEQARYRVRVTTEDLRLIAAAGELTTAEFVVAPAALDGVPPGTTLLWQVEMSLPTGPTTTSPTFHVRVR